MAHTTQTETTTFIHNGGYDGDVIIRREGKEILVPMDDLILLVAGWVRSEWTAKVEQMQPKEIVLAGLPMGDLVPRRR